MKTNDDIKTEISTAIERDDAASLQKTISENSLGGTNLLDGWLALAAQLGHLATLAVLLEHDVNVNCANHDGETALSFACANNQFAAAKLLHAAGADVNTVDASGGTPLDWAVCHCHPDFRQWLRSVGGTRKLDFDEWPWAPLGASPRERDSDK